MARSRRKAALLWISIIGLTIFLLYRTSRDRTPSVPSFNVPAVLSAALSEYNGCLISKFDSLDAHELWSSLGSTIDHCLPNSTLKNIQIDEYHNSEEKKWHVRVASGQEAVVSVGIGGDILAEEALKNDSVIPPAFFGADPIYDKNDALYSTIGLYFPFAVGAATGMFDSNVLFNGTYWFRQVVQLDLPSFLRGFVYRSVVDVLWLDAEGGEFLMMDMFYDGGKLDQEGLTLCQIHMEAHQPNKEREKLLSEFLYRIANEQKYVLLRAMGSIDLRLFLLNVSNEDCLRRFVLRFLPKN